MNNIMISGYAKLPAHITSEEVYKQLVVAVLVDMDNSTIIKAEASMVTQLARDFIADLMVGYNMDTDVDGLLGRIEEHYFGTAKKALETCVKMVFVKYEEITSGLKPKTE